MTEPKEPVTYRDILAPIQKITSKQGFVY